MTFFQRLDFEKFLACSHFSCVASPDTPWRSSPWPAMVCTCAQDTPPRDPCAARRTFTRLTDSLRGDNSVCARRFASRARRALGGALVTLRRSRVHHGQSTIRAPLRAQDRGGRRRGRTLRRGRAKMNARRRPSPRGYAATLNYSNWQRDATIYRYARNRSACVATVAVVSLTAAPAPLLRERALVYLSEARGRATPRCSCCCSAQVQCTATALTHGCVCTNQIANGPVYVLYRWRSSAIPTPPPPLLLPEVTPVLTTFDTTADPGSAATPPHQFPR